MMLVDADPIFKRGDLAAWLVKDIPVGVIRRAAAVDLANAFSVTALGRKMAQSASDVDLGADHRLVACVLWADLQPLWSVPRGRDAMTSARWGRDRAADGVCTVCSADDSMWCDTAMHELHALAVAHGATLIGPPARQEIGPRGPRPRHEIYAELSGLKHRPGGGGQRGPCDPACHRCHLQRELGRAMEVKIDAGLLPTIPIQPSDAPLDRVLAAAMSSGFFGERHPPATAEMRAAWSRELRRRVQASEERERNRVLVDRAFEEWE